MQNIYWFSYCFGGATALLSSRSRCRLARCLCSCWTTKMVLFSPCHASTLLEINFMGVFISHRTMGCIRFHVAKRHKNGRTPVILLIFTYQKPASKHVTSLTDDRLLTSGPELCFQQAPTQQVQVLDSLSPTPLLASGDLRQVDQDSDCPELRE